MIWQLKKQGQHCLQFGLSERNWYYPCPYYAVTLGCNYCIHWAGLISLQTALADETNLVLLIVTFILVLYDVVDFPTDSCHCPGAPPSSFSVQNVVQHPGDDWADRTHVTRDLYAAAGRKKSGIGGGALLARRPIYVCVYNNLVARNYLSA